MIGATRAAVGHALSESIDRWGIEASPPLHLALRDVVDNLALFALCFAFVLTVALSLSAIHRRTGDAHQYVAMALQLSQLHPPSLSPDNDDRQLWRHDPQ